ncbi:MAG: alanine racemase [Gemmatimonadales bacterium]
MVSRRTFLIGSAAGLGVFGTAGAESGRSDVSAAPGRRYSRAAGSGAGFDPWVEIDAGALAHNARVVAELAEGRPVLGVVKNNAYGLGLETAGPVLDSLDEIAGLAVVKTSEAIALRDAGVAKPILLMGLFEERDAPELVARDISLAPYWESAPEVLRSIARRFGRRLSVHLYLDTGMSRLGMPYYRAAPWITELATLPEVAVKGTFMTFTEGDDFDPEQLRRFLDLAREVRARGIDIGRLHAASSHALFHRRNALLDMVRPGLVLYGAFPLGARNDADLRPALRLKARVVRVEQLRPGDSVSYGRNYMAERPTWVATLPVGHADGYPRRAVEGCVVQIRNEVYPVIGAVSASHTIVEIGTEQAVEVGDEATLVGPDDPAIHPNTVAERADMSVYDVLMHLSRGLPKKLINA